MNDQTDQSLGDQPQVTMPRLSEAAVENILTLEHVMASARLVEKKAVVCLRGDLEAVHDSLISELRTLVDAEGNVVARDESLADQKVARVEEIQTLLEENRQARLAESYVVRFQAMPADEWAEFEKAHRESIGGPVKDARDYQRKIIARCAIEPKLTEAEVDQLSGTLSSPQMNALFAAAYEACTTGGLDVPKSPLFSATPKP